jgi:hypothetical protein
MELCLATRAQAVSSRNRRCCIQKGRPSSDGRPPPFRATLPPHPPNHRRGARPATKLQRLAQELLRHFSLAPGGAPGAVPDAAGACGAAEEWHVLLYPDLSAHRHLKNTSWGPVYCHDVTVGGTGAKNWP